MPTCLIAYGVNYKKGKCSGIIVNGTIWIMAIFQRKDSLPGHQGPSISAAFESNGGELKEKVYFIPNDSLFAALTR